jgi:hypothetical protein
MANQQVRPLDSRAREEGMELISILPHGARRRADITPGISRSVVAACGSKLSNLWLDQAEVYRISPTTIEKDDRGFPLTSAMNVEAVTTHIYQFAGRSRLLYFCGTLVCVSWGGPDAQYDYLKNDAGQASTKGFEHALFLSFLSVKEFLKSAMVALARLVRIFPGSA